LKVLTTKKLIKKLLFQFSEYILNKLFWVWPFSCDEDIDNESDMCKQKKVVGTMECKMTIRLRRPDWQKIEQKKEKKLN